MLDHGRHELVRLVVTSPGIPLLAPAAGRRAGLHIPRADLVQEQLSATNPTHGIPTAAHQDDAEGVVGEVVQDGVGAIGTDDPLRHTRGHLAPMSLDEAVEPGGQALRGDLDNARGRRSAGGARC